MLRISSLVLMLIAMLGGCQTTNVYYGKIPEDGSGTSLELRQQALRDYTYRGGGGWLFRSSPSDRPRDIPASIISHQVAEKEIQRSSLVSYMVYDNGALVINLTSPHDRFGKILEADPSIYSMSLGKSLTGYFMAHALCQGYISSLDQKLADWPLVANTFIADSTVREVINASMGHQIFLKNNEEFLSGRFVQGSLRSMIILEKLEGSEPGQKRYAYGQLPASVALNYITFKTGHEFRDFSNKILRDHVRLSGELKWAHTADGSEQIGIIHPNFNATREDTLRIGLAILEDWNSQTCVGKALKDIYVGRVKKNRHADWGSAFGRSRAYAGFFHTDYTGLNDTVMGMDGYGGISMLINFDKNRIVYAHAVARDYDHGRLIFDMIENGP